MSDLETTSGREVLRRAYFVDHHFFLYTKLLEAVVVLITSRKIVCLRTSGHRYKYQKMNMYVSVLSAKVTSLFPVPLPVSCQSPQEKRLARSFCHERFRKKICKLSGDTGERRGVVAENHMRNSRVSPEGRGEKVQKHRFCFITRALAGHLFWSAALNTSL